MKEIFTFLIPTDVPTANGNIYPKEVVRKALEEYKKTHVDKGSAFGCLDRREDAERDYIRLERASHLITDSVEVPNGFMITAKCLKNPMGRILRAIPEKHVDFGTVSYIKMDDTNKMTEMTVLSIDAIKKN